MELTGDAAKLDPGLTAQPALDDRQSPRRPGPAAPAAVRRRGHQLGEQRRPHVDRNLGRRPQELLERPRVRPGEPALEEMVEVALAHAQPDLLGQLAAHGLAQRGPVWVGAKSVLRRERERDLD